MSPPARWRIARIQLKPRNAELQLAKFMHHCVKSWSSSIFERLFDFFLKSTSHFTSGEMAESKNSVEAEIAEFTTMDMMSKGL